MFRSPASILFLSSFLVTPELAAAPRQDSFHIKPVEKHKSVFTGNETVIDEVGWLRPDCTVAAPDIRIVVAPKKGTVRFEDTPMPVTASQKPLQKKCYGKTVNAVRIHYRSDEKFTGRDTVVLDIDSKLGGTGRRTYLINVDRVKADSPKPAAVGQLPEARFSRSVFSGNETRLAAFNYVNADCSSGPLPDLRIVTEPAHGAYRLEPTTIQIDRKPDDARAACNGKAVSAVAVHYKPTAEFVGGDDLVVDVDFRNGTVRRYIYAISVR
jgi:hypothetical protein